MTRFIAALAVLAASATVLLAVGTASAVPPVGAICPAGDSGKIDVVGDFTSLTITAPEGFLITGYCVKAGSANQGLGAEFYVVDPPQASVTITHSSGKAISHYSFTVDEKEEPPPPPPCDPKVEECDPPPPPPCDPKEEECEEEPK